MKFIKTELEGAYIIEMEPFKDYRGTFARVFCANEFKEHGLDYNLVQTNHSVTLKKGVIRGMHYQVEGTEEAKLLRCVCGKILDVIIDIRKSSKTFGKHIAVELSDSNNKMLYVPRGFAHGFLTLSDNCHVTYQVSNFYAPGKEKGIRWNDPFFAIDWPIKEPVLSDKDANLEDYKPEE